MIRVHISDVIDTSTDQVQPVLLFFMNEIPIVELLTSTSTERPSTRQHH